VRRPLAVLILPFALSAQTRDVKEKEKEDSALQQALAEAGGTPVEYSRALEKHLKKFPNSDQRKEIERVIVEAAIDLKDRRRLVEYGPRVLDAGNQDLKVLDHVTRALLDNLDKTSNEKALGYARALRAGAERWLEKNDATGPGRGRRIDDYENRRSRAVAFEARALGNLGQLPEAVTAARQAHQLYPTDETAREVARWLERSGQVEPALPFLAEAFAGAPAPARTRDREKLRTLYVQLKGSETGLGDMVLAAFDRVQKQTEDRIAHIKAIDPNALATQAHEFTLTGLKGGSLALASLKGKIVVLDFWATWCGPCRDQHPLYEKVKAHYTGNANVVFLAVNADDERELVPPFLTAQKWSQEVWYDEGLQSLFRINSIPTTLILDGAGQVFSRLPGFIPSRFVDMLQERVDEALLSLRP
jgi:thiol-disulfide isomerase/thioredoxin